MRLGTLLVRVVRARRRAFLQVELVRLERRAAEVGLLIREAVLRRPVCALSGVSYVAHRGAGQCRHSVAPHAGLGPGGGALSPGAAGR